MILTILLYSIAAIGGRELSFFILFGERFILWEAWEGGRKGESEVGKEKKNEYVNWRKGGFW